MFSQAADHVLDAADDRQVAVGVADEQVAGAEPIAVEAAGVGIGALVVAEQDRAAADLRLARLADRAFAAVIPDDVGLAEGCRHATGARIQLVHGRHWHEDARARTLYKGRARIEQAVGKIKRFKRVALRCEKTKRNFASFVALTAGFILLKSVHTA